MQDTSAAKLSKSPLCPRTWVSEKQLLHRRTVILFNEFHPTEKALQFSPWLGPQVSPQLYAITEEWNKTHDNEKTALSFLSKLCLCIWAEVLSGWKEVARLSTLHVRAAQRTAIAKNTSVDSLEKLARDTWEDTVAWATLRTLLGVHKKLIYGTQHDLEKLAASIGLTLDTTEYKKLVKELDEIELQFSDDLTRHGQSTSDIIFNLMNVANAKAAESFNNGLGRIQWVSFVFFPLILVSGLFGMNIDLLADNPSFVWYFAIAIPFMALVLVPMLVAQHYTKIQAKIAFWRHQGRVIGRGQAV
ncbi:hypothetical protein B0T18DRAFT_427746 [Schizothecium vesticola]|uniref:Cora-domain-containing protein n=1 Tax=Schizothecium vesticola TaxID=314040 RepID=A0AA40F2G2_9PEZI|nr:hypothetical protein B0T18DRAFT_427746 [Schizothecium vesticola]